jgi:uncharacterized protein (DUF433 family)
MVGKPAIKGTRIPVERVIQDLARNPDLTDLFAGYPELTLDDVKACLEFAHAAVVKTRVHPGAKEVLTAHPAQL